MLLHRVWIRPTLNLLCTFIGRLALLHHPDKHPDDPQAEERVSAWSLRRMPLNLTSMRMACSSRRSPSRIRSCRTPTFARNTMVRCTTSFRLRCAELCSRCRIRRQGRRAGRWLCRSRGGLLSHLRWRPICAPDRRNLSRKGHEGGA